MRCLVASETSQFINEVQVLRILNCHILGFPCQFHFLFAVIDDYKVFHVDVCIDVGGTAWVDGGILSMEVGEGDVANVSWLQIEGGAFYFPDIHLSCAEHTQLQVFRPPCNFAFETAVSANADTLQIGGRHI